MDFWVGLALFGVLCIVAERLLKPPLNRVVPYILIGVLWFISAFRYMIGFDYEAYMNMFYSVEIGAIYPEISFIYLCNWLRNNGLDYQSMFMFYSLSSYIFLWLGIKTYFKSSNKRVLALILFVFLNHYWFSFNGVRQFMAMSICFFAAKYIVNRELIKFILSVLFAVLWHNSAIVFLPIYWFAGKRFSNSFFILGLIISFIASFFDVVLLTLEIILPYLGLYEAYLLNVFSDAFEGGTGVMMIVWNISFLVSLLLRENLDDGIENMVINMYWLGLVYIFLFSFSDVFYRLKNYFNIFGILFYTNIIFYLNRRFRTQFFYSILLIFFITFLYGVNKMPTSENNLFYNKVRSAGNIEYQFNFQILQ